ncbi:MAG: hypothetical protein P8182_09445, partial [Deltaproteobacteria bacterium]
YVLVRIPNNDIKELARLAKLNTQDFSSAYLIDRTSEYGVGIFLVTYTHNEHSVPPPDGKLRELNPDYHWLNVESQLLIPPPSSPEARPLQYSIIYA